jgi:hypothetical protein
VKTVYLTLIVFPLLLAVSCSNETTQEKTARLCTNLATLGSSVANLKSINPNSTMGEFRNAEREVKTAFGEVQTSARDVQDARLDDLQTANNNLDRAIQDIPSNATLQEAVISISDDVLAVEVAQDQLRSGLNCP